MRLETKKHLLCDLFFQELLLADMMLGQFTAGSVDI